VVEEATLKLRTLSARQVIDELDRLRAGLAKPAVLFDADGTLWSGDVGIEAFVAAYEHGLLREEAAAALSELSALGGLESHGTPSEIARRIDHAYRAGSFPEFPAWEMMTWCYAGWTLDEVGEHSRRTNRDQQLIERLHRELEPILEFTRKSGIRSVVVSASPRRMVEEAAALWGFAAADIAAATPAMLDGRVAPRIAGTFPYGPGKLTNGRALLGDDAEWLAAFGDSVSDFEMLEQSRLGVAVSPKPALRKRLPELKHAVLLG
jgi:phosphatidylglycerophosphatase C